MTNPADFGAAQQHKYYAQYQANKNNFLKKTDIQYGDVANFNADNADEYLEGYFMGKYTGAYKHSVKIWDGNANEWSITDLAASLGISDGLYEHLASNLGVDGDRNGFYAIAKALDGGDTKGFDGTIEAAYRQQKEQEFLAFQKKEAEREKRNYRYIDGAKASQGYLNKYKTKPDAMRNVDIQYGDAADIVEDPRKASMHYINGYVLGGNFDGNQTHGADDWDGTVGNKTPEEYAKSLGISVKLYKAIISGLPEQLKHPS